jgi:hypothetical protein
MRRPKVIETSKTKSLLSSLYEREELPSLKRKGWGDFSGNGWLIPFQGFARGNELCLSD